MNNDGDKIVNAKKYTLIDLLNSFTVSELKQFSSFVNARYFNTDKYAIRLLRVLREEIVGKESFQYSLWKKIFRKTFSKEKLNDNELTEKQGKLLRAKMSVLVKLVKEFFKIEALKNNEIYQQALLTQKLLEKKHFSLFNHLLKISSNQLHAKKLNELDSYEYALQLEKDKLNELYQSGKITNEDNLQKVNFYLDLQYLLDKLELYSTMLSLQKAINHKSYDYSSIYAIQSILEIPQYEKNPLILLHQANINLIKNYSEENFLHLIKLLKHLDTNIPKKYLIDFYTVASNFCSIQIRKGKLEYFQNIFSIYKEMDEKNLIVLNKIININTLKNIIVVSCHIKDFHWAIMIINKYILYVSHLIRESVYQYYLGIIEFYKSNYKKAISHFIRVDKVNLIFDIEARLQMLKAHYEMDQEYDERTIQIFRSAERFIQTQQPLARSSKSGYKNFIQILINLYRVKHKIGKRALESVTNKLNKMTSINDKKWLLEKIASLE